MTSEEWYKRVGTGHIDIVLIIADLAASESREAALVAALRDLRDKVRKAGEHPQRRGEWEDVADSLRVADAALASVKEGV